MRKLITLVGFAVALLAPRAALAFCGFYVAGADAKMFNNATMVVMMRDGQRTVLSMQNNYQGPPADFAMVVPVPVILQKKNVKTLPRKIFDRVDRLAAPRLVEYWEQDPCMPMAPGGLGLSGIGRGGGGIGQGFGSGLGRLGGVRVEAEFAVGEYEIVILSAKDAGGLELWLKTNGYKIPAGAEPLLKPYVAAGSKFFVAKVNPKKVKFADGMATLSPLRFHYDSKTFSLPVRLGLINSAGTQDLIVHILGRGKRYQVANYPNVTIPTNLDVKDSARKEFGSFYAALFDEAIGPKGDAVVTEYAWSAKGCDPCPDPPLTNDELATLGADVIDDVKDSLPPESPKVPRLRMANIKVEGALPPEVVRRIVRQNFGRFRLCYERALKNKPDATGSITVSGRIANSGRVASSTATAKGVDASVGQCAATAVKATTFPRPEKGDVRFSFDVKLSLSSRLRRGPVWGGARDIVLTRLHARYGKDALGADLVFEEAPPIEGGRERRRKGKLEQGAVVGSRNNFQARYAIRHAWEGDIKCDNPRRGIWGAKPKKKGELSIGRPKARAAQNLAFAPRGGGISLASFLAAGAPSAQKLAKPPPKPASSGKSAAPSPGPSASGTPAPAPSAAPTSPPAGGCGCALVGQEPTSRASWAWLLAAGLVIGRRASRGRRGR